MNTKGVACFPNNIPSEQDFLEIQFEKTVGKVPYNELKSKAIEFSVHAPFYTTIASDKEQKVTDAKRRILEAVEVARQLSAKVVVIHAGFYAKQEPKQVYEKVKNNLIDLSKGIGRIKLGVELMPRFSQFGSLEEIMRLNEELEEVVPVIDVEALRIRHPETNLEEAITKDSYVHYTKEEDEEILDKLVSNGVIVKESPF